MKEEEKRPPGPIKRAANFSHAVAKHAKDGFVDVSTEDYIARIEVCNSCEFHKEGVCNHKDCGCILSRKAWWRSENCPIGKWPKTS